MYILVHGGQEVEAERGINTGARCCLRILTSSMKPNVARAFQSLKVFLPVLHLGTQISNWKNYI